MPAVVDASALVELLSGGPAAITVAETLTSSEAFAPELVDAEVAHVLARLERAGAVDASEAARRLRLLLDAPIVRVPHAGLIPDAWRRRHDLSIYDSVYVALAARLRGTLLTADRRLAASPLTDVAVTLVPTRT